MAINYAVCLLVCLLCLIKFNKIATGLPVTDPKRLYEVKRQHWTASLRPGGKRSFEDKGQQFPRERYYDTEANFGPNRALSRQGTAKGKGETTARKFAQKLHWTAGLSSGGKKNTVFNQKPPATEVLNTSGQWFDPGDAYYQDKNFGKYPSSTDHTIPVEFVNCLFLKKFRDCIQEFALRGLEENMTSNYGGVEFQNAPELPNYDGSDGFHHGAPAGIPLAQMPSDMSMMSSLPLYPEESLEFENPSFSQ